MHIRVGNAADLVAIRALLEREKLPSSDLESAEANFVVVCDSGERVRAGGALEWFGEPVLLRSLSVAPELRGTGLGRRLVQELESLARSRHITEVVLLTTTAQDFFSRLGYRAIERASAPQSVHASEEFPTLCPAPAACMLKQLGQSD